MADPILITILVTSGLTFLTQIFSSIKSNHFKSKCCSSETGSCMSVEMQTVMQDKRDSQQSDVQNA